MKKTWDLLTNINDIDEISCNYISERILKQIPTRILAAICNVVDGRIDSYREGVYTIRYPLEIDWLMIKEDNNPIGRRFKIGGINCFKTELFERNVLDGR
ncbi:MAG: hypothetical protein HWN81_00605 [Candidatus Lokiarchaeota archaeon]|nr:hypothetical protein [Candidatus Lokiarchaeota archaeon]